MSVSADLRIVFTKVNYWVGWLNQSVFCSILVWESVSYRDTVLRKAGLLHHTRCWNHTVQFIPPYVISVQARAECACHCYADGAASDGFAGNEGSCAEDIARGQRRACRSRARTSGEQHRGPQNSHLCHTHDCMGHHTQFDRMRVLSWQRWGQLHTRSLTPWGFCHDRGWGKPTLTLWLDDAPVTTEMRQFLLAGCYSCHDMRLVGCCAPTPAPYRDSAQMTRRAPGSSRPQTLTSHGLRPGQSAAAAGHAGARGGRAGKQPPHLQASPTAERKLSRCMRPASPPPPPPPPSRRRADDRPRCAGPRRAPPPPQRRGRSCAFPPPRAARPANERRPHAAAARGARAAQLP